MERVLLLGKPLTSPRYIPTKPHSDLLCKIISNDLSHGPKKEWADVAQTSYARKRILDFNDK